MTRRSHVVTGGAGGIGRAIVERLLQDPDHRVVAIDLTAMDSPDDANGRLLVVKGDAADPDVAESAADIATQGGPLAGWVNNAAIFRDVPLHSTPSQEVTEIIGLNLHHAVVGSATAVRRFLAQGGGGAIVNVSSHQATRAVRGALAYATAKAGIEGLTRATAVDYGSHGIRANAVALGSIETNRSAGLLQRVSAAEAARIESEIRRLHPLGRIGSVEEVASVVAFLLSDESGFVSGVVIPVDGGRSALGLDPEARELD